MAVNDNILIVIGMSAGGLAALSDLIENLPEDLPATIIISNHRPLSVKNLLLDILKTRTDLKVTEPVEGEKLSCTTLYVSAGGQTVTVDNHRAHLDFATDRFQRMKTIDDLFISVAKDSGKNAVGIILTGMLDDGVAGLEAIKAHGGITIVQDPSNAEFESMPNEALERVKPDFIGKPNEIGSYIKAICKEEQCTETP